MTKNEQIFKSINKDIFMGIFDVEKDKKLTSLLTTDVLDKIRCSIRFLLIHGGIVSFLQKSGEGFQYSS